MTQKKFSSKVPSLNSQGQGICSYEGLKVFVDDVLIGEEVSVELTLKKKNYGIGKLKDILSSSPHRIEPVCPIFHQCGGCQLMHMDDVAQLDFKTQKVKEALSKIGGFDLDPEPCVSSPSKLSYRNKLQLPFFEKDSQLTLGLYQRGTHTPIEVQACYIHCPLGEKVFKALLPLLKACPLKAYNEKSNRGELRHLLIRSAPSTHECLVTFIATSKKCLTEIKDIAEKLMKVCPEVKGVLLNVNQRRYNSIIGNEFTLVTGKPHIYEKLFELPFKISPSSFFQVNSKQAENLYSQALKFLDLLPEHHLLDAYCGIGTFSLIASKHVKSVTGIEVVESAIKDAQENAKSNQIQNCKFIHGVVEKKIFEIKPVDRALINPPRKGCDPKVLEALCEQKPQKIVYISCDPATLARDLKILCEKGYKLKAVIPFDMFPQTYHVESCALLEIS